MALTDSERIARDLLKAALQGDVETIVKLKKVGGSLGTADKNGRTMLMVAVDQNKIAVVKYLLAEKVDVNAETVTGWTAIDIAESRGRRETFELLLAAGALRTPGGIQSAPHLE